MKNGRRRAEIDEATESSSNTVAVTNGGPSNSTQIVATYAYQVAIAAGLQPKMTLNHLYSVETVTAYIVQVSLGDTPTGTIEYKTIYVAGMSLFLVTLAFNVFSHWLKKRFREEYD